MEKGEVIRARIGADLKEKVRAKTEERGFTMSEVIRVLLEQWLADNLLVDTKVPYGY